MSRTQSQQSRGLFVLLAVACLAPVVSRADEVSEAAFTQTFVEKLTKAVPNHHFTVGGPLELRDSVPGSPAAQLYLDRIYQYSQQNPAQAEAAEDAYVGRLASVIKESDQPLDKARIMVAIRNARSIEASLKAGHMEPSLLYLQPLAGDLTEMLVVDSPDAVKYLTTADCKKLALKDSEPFAIGLQNLRTHMKPLLEAAKVPGKGSLSLIQEDYAPSRLLFLDDWAPMAKALGGNLIVTAPATDCLLIGEGSSEIGVNALRTFGLQLAKKSEAPLSETILRWHPDHWEVLK